MNKFTTAIMAGMTSAAAAFAADPLQTEAEEEEEALIQEISSPMEILPGLTLGVLTEVSASYADTDAGDSSDINFDTFELTMSAAISDGVTFEGVLLYEEGEDLCIDSAFFDVAVPQLEGLSFQAGLMYMPFGVFNGAMISDPMTLELGEISDASAGITYSVGPLTLSGYVFGADIEDSDNVDNYAAAFSLTPVENFQFGAAVLSDIGEAGLCDDIIDSYEEFGYEDAMGIDVWATLSFGSFSISGEYLAAVDDLSIAGEKVKPQTWAVDIVQSFGERTVLGLRYEGSREFKTEEFPENQFGACLSYLLTENLTLSGEYMYGKFDDAAEIDDRHMVTAKLAFEF